jgi:hypothetical protein
MVKILGQKEMQDVVGYAENKNIFSKIKYFSSNDLCEGYFYKKKKQDFFFAILDEDEKEVLALSKIQNSDTENDYYIAFISTSPGYEGNGFAKSMIEAIHEWALENEKTITPSSFTSKGQRLKNHFLKMKEKYPNVCKWESLGNFGWQTFDWKFLSQDLKTYPDKKFDDVVSKLNLSEQNFDELQDFVQYAHKKLNKKEMSYLCYVLTYYGWKPFNPDIENIEKNIQHLKSGLNFVK